MEKFSKLKEEMNAHALADYPREAVGIVTNNFEYIRCKNISPSPKISFLLDPEALVKNDGNIWAYFILIQARIILYLVKKTRLVLHLMSINF